ncbi:IS110 family transposase [Streptococcus anginosus]|uniref:IS110 family transposase n=1 Tax=Streptococcus anginosus TaxID=1328 RepID=UPI0030C6A95A
MTLDVVQKTGKTPVLGRMLSKYVERQTSSIENNITKTRSHSRQRGNFMRVVFGIDVSKASSEVAILVNGEKVHGYTMSNDTIEFARLLSDLKTVQHPEIIFEALGSIHGAFRHFLRKMAMLIHGSILWKPRNN